jgi:hypothetical protein
MSLNPVPALVILLLGIMMSSHLQSSMISSMVHKQWGNLLSGASLARITTYVIMYLKPPASVLPPRPLTELLTAFGLTAGGCHLHGQCEFASQLPILSGVLGVLLICRHHRAMTPSRA